MGTITKALELLNFFSRSRPEIGLGEFVRLSGRDKATVHRHLVELEQNGFLEQHPETRAYRLGPAILRLAGVREAINPMRSLLRPIVSMLAEDVGELAHVSLLQGNALSPLVHADPRVYGTQVHFDESEVLPIHATSSGLAALAFASRAMQRKVLGQTLKAFTPYTITDPERLTALIDEISLTGISHLDRAYDEEVASQAAPIFDANNKVIGALSVAVPTVRATQPRLDSIATRLIAAAKAATLSLGGAYPQLQQSPQQAEPSSETA